MVTNGEWQYGVWADVARDPRVFEELPGPVRAAWELVAEDWLTSRNRGESRP